MNVYFVGEHTLTLDLKGTGLPDICRRFERGEVNKDAVITIGGQIDGQMTIVNMANVTFITVEGWVGRNNGDQNQQAGN